MGAVLVGLLTAACGRQPPPWARVEVPAAPVTTAEASSARTAEPRPAFHTATGRLAAFDSGARLVTVETVTGASTYHVAADARVWIGRRRLPVGDLAGHLGAQTLIAFAEADGVRTTHTVRLAEGGAGRAR